MIEDFRKISPLRILEDSSKRRLSTGDLGVIIARAGVGKTACLIHFAFDTLFRAKKLLHISLDDTPEKITSYYNLVFADLMRAMGIEDESGIRESVEGNRMILAYVRQSFEVERLRENLKNLVDRAAFDPDTLVLDGLDFENRGRETFEGLKELAMDFQAGIWFSALSHRHITEVNERGIPYPCHKVDDLFNIIMQLEPQGDGVLLKLLKGGDNGPSKEVSLSLNPKTLLARE